MGRERVREITRKMDELAAQLVKEQDVPVVYFRLAHSSGTCRVIEEPMLIYRIVEVGLTEGLPGAKLKCLTHGVSSHEFYKDD